MSTFKDFTDTEQAVASAGGEIFNVRIETFKGDGSANNAASEGMGETDSDFVGDIQQDRRTLATKLGPDGDRPIEVQVRIPGSNKTSDGYLPLGEAVDWAIQQQA